MLFQPLGQVFFQETRLSPREMERTGDFQNGFFLFEPQRDISLLRCIERFDKGSSLLNAPLPIQLCLVRLRIGGQQLVVFSEGPVGVGVIELDGDMGRLRR